MKYEVGDRVSLHPATAAWMQGDRYGEVVGVLRRDNQEWVHLRMDSGRLLRVNVRNILGKVVWSPDKGWE